MTDLEFCMVLAALFCAWASAAHWTKTGKIFAALILTLLTVATLLACAGSRN